MVERSIDQLAECLRALGHPTRLQIVDGLIKNECNVTQIQQNLNIPQSTISQHPEKCRDHRKQEGRKYGMLQSAGQLGEGPGYPCEEEIIFFTSIL